MLDKNRYPGELGLRNVKLNNRYRVENGNWEFLVTKIEGDLVRVKHANGSHDLSILESETTKPLWITKLTGNK